MHRFYVPGFPVSGDAELPSDEGQHLVRVLRLRAGETIAIFDGRGREALARIESTAPKRVRVRILGPRTPSAEPSVSVTLAQALLKSDKMDQVVRDAVMLGVAAIQPLVTRRIDLPSAARKSGARHERWDRTAVSSAKQCGRAVVPPVHTPITFQEMLAGTRGLRLMFVEPGTAGAAADLRSLEGARPAEALVMVGPEGGWAAEEVATALADGVMLVTLGRLVLRADAAGLVALAVLRYVWRDL